MSLSSPVKAERTQPFGAQIEALYYLEQARAEGLNKGLVVAATGVGKTYLSAFDSVKFKRVLFVAHREEILYHYFLGQQRCPAGTRGREVVECTGAKVKIKNINAVLKG